MNYHHFKVTEKSGYSSVYLSRMWSLFGFYEGTEWSKKNKQNIHVPPLWQEDWNPAEKLSYLKLLQH